MKEKTEKSLTRIILNYHLHPNVGGVGHISIDAINNGQPVKLSVYPSEQLSMLTPITVTSAYLFPALAKNHLDSHEGDSPIFASFDITDKIIHKEAFFAELHKMRTYVDSGEAAFSLIPNPRTQILFALFSKKSALNLVRGFKTLDHDTMNEELTKFPVYNCSSTAADLLKIGGIELTQTFFAGYHSPTSIYNSLKSLFEKLPDPVQTEVPKASQKTAIGLPGAAMKQPNLKSGSAGFSVNFFQQG
ncbi:MAG: hypothetical protein EPN84_04320, partial [Legionella sp.]